jgi:choline dehydrogenase-like flavoprotein
MILDTDSDGRQVGERSFDACVVGSGPAGITVARKLAAAGYSVALMEGGGLEIDARSQDLYVGESIGREYWPLDAPRLRFFGGTSNHWGGRSRPLEPHNFSHFSFAPLSGWPIAKADLDPFAPETDEILDIPSAEPDPKDPLLDPAMQAIRYRRSPPTRFGEKYHDELAASDRITLVVNANLVDLELTPDLRTVSAAIFKSYQPGDPGFAVRARCFVLCLGGMENPRFLLNANRQIPAGIGNENDLVGRFFSEHYAYSVGHVLFEDEIPPSRVYQPTPEMMEEHRILDFELLLSTQRRSLSRSLARSVVCSNDFIARLSVQVLGRTIDCDAADFGDYLASLEADQSRGTLGLISEQSLNPDSRVLLGEERDMFGHRRIVLDWRYSDLDLWTMRTAMMVTAQRFAESGTGRVQLRDWLLDETLEPPQFGTPDAGEVAICHHMCTTRMSADPRQGVVDANCRLHSVDNLYLGGSSVFATGGHANPTYTIVELALRLGDHLSGVLEA